MIYLDHHATTPPDSRVVDAMLPYFTTRWGNTSSAHEIGTRACEATEAAREQVAALLGAQASEIVWTSGATEANNLAILGLARGCASLNAAKNAAQRRRIVISAIEHKAVLEPCRALQREGFETVILPVDSNGHVRLQAAREALDERTLLLSVQAANGEVGAIQPVAALSQLAHEVGAWVHCDAAQAVGKIPLDVEDCNLDLLSLSGHKLYGPQGIGALYVRRGLGSRLAPLQHGGGQERGLRPGTLPLALVVGLGAACELCQNEMESEAKRLQTLRDALEASIASAWPTLRVNGARGARLPHNSSLTFPGLPADALLTHLPEVALSTGAACDSGALEPSRTLQAIGLSRADASSTVRLGLGRNTTKAEVEFVATRFAHAAKQLWLKAD